MSEYVSELSLFTLDRTQITPVARKVKSADKFTIEAQDRLSEQRPLMKMALMERVRFYEEGGYYEDSASVFIAGACMAYATCEKLAETYGFRLPPDCDPPASELIAEINTKLNDPDYIFRGAKGLMEALGIINFKERLTAYYYVALEAYGRRHQIPAREIDDVLTSEDIVRAADFVEVNQTTRSPSDLRVLDHAMCFVDGYSQVMQLLHDANTADKLPDLFNF